MGTALSSWAPAGRFCSAACTGRTESATALGMHSLEPTRVRCTVIRRTSTRHDSAPVTASAASGQGGIWVPGQEAVRIAVVNEGVISQPLHGPSPGPGVPERVSRWQQVWVLPVELVFEPAEGSLALDRPCQPAPGPFVGYPIGEVGHVLVPDPGRQRADDDQVQLVEVDRRLAVDAGVGRPERDLSGVRVDQPVVFVVGLVGQRARDLLQIDAAQVQHPARISLCRCPRSRTRTASSGIVRS